MESKAVEQVEIWLTVIPALAWASLTAIGCSSETGKAQDPQGEPVLPAAKVSQAEKHHAALSGLRKSPTGKPILVERPASESRAGKRFVFDRDKDDAVTRWGECLSLVRRCYASDSLTACVDAVARCGDNTGGIACCPPACVTQFDQLVQASLTPLDAIDQSFVKGTCVDGFTDLVGDRSSGVKL